MSQKAKTLWEWTVKGLEGVIDLLLEYQEGQLPGMTPVDLGEIDRSIQRLEKIRKANSPE
jgi:hypothetical protein